MFHSVIKKNVTIYYKNNMDTPNYPVHIDLEKLKRNNLVCDDTSLIHQRQCKYSVKAVLYA